MFATLPYLTFEDKSSLAGDPVWGLEQRLFQLFEDSKVNGCEF